MKKLIIIFAAIAMVGSFTATAMADVELYGSARFRTFWQDVDEVDANGATTGDSDSDLEWRMGHLSRFGANFKSDKITGKFELDARSGGAGATDNIEAGSQASRLGNMRLRNLWGQYDFGSFKLMIGQNFPLFDAPVSSINYYSGGLQPYGGMGYTDARTSQLRLTMGNLRIAFLSPDTSLTDLNLTGGTDVDTTFPKVEVRYDMKLGDTGELNLIGGYQTYDVEGVDPVLGAFDESVDSYVLGVRGKFNFGPAYVGLGVSYRVNGGPYDVWSASTKENPVYENGSFEDADSIGAVVALGFKVSDMLNLEASYSKLMSEQDTALDNEDDLQVFALQAKFTVAPGVFIVPEFIFQDNEDKIDNGVTRDQGEATVFGVWWLINFN